MNGSPDLFLEPAIRFSNALLASYLSYLQELRGISYGWKRKKWLGASSSSIILTS
jgi:Co/Zn/Cd efflux system component